MPLSLYLFYLALAVGGAMVVGFVLGRFSKR